MNDDGGARTRPTIVVEAQSAAAPASATVWS
jgi:hypothetical protein